MEAGNQKCVGTLFLLVEHQMHTLNNPCPFSIMFLKWCPEDEEQGTLGPEEIMVADKELGKIPDFTEYNQVQLVFETSLKRAK